MEPNRLIKTGKKFPFTLTTVDEATEKRVSMHFKGPIAGLVQVGPEKFLMSKYFAENADDLYNFEARTDDIYVSTFIRSGTTLTQEMIWLLCNDLNYEYANATKLGLRFPFFEVSSMLPKIYEHPKSKALREVLPPPAPQLLAKMTSQRLIKTHLPIKMLPYDVLDKRCKIVYVARNPKDVIVSSYHFTKGPGFGYNGNFEQFVDYFMDDLITWGPYFKHIKDGWSHRSDENVLFLFYEDLIMDLKGSIEKLAMFLERPLSDNSLPELMTHLNIENMKQNSSVNRKEVESVLEVKLDFVRHGRIGGNPEMTREISEKIDEWMEKQLMDSDLEFPHQFHHDINSQLEK